MPFTIKDIANRAGVSPGTVSKVLNDAPGVGPETRARIRRLVQELDYEPNALAHGLAARRTGNIGVIVPHTGSYFLGGSYWPLLLTSIAEQSAAKNLNVVLSTARSDEDVESAYRSLLKGRKVDGVIVGGEDFGLRQHSELLLKNVPFVMVGKAALLPQCFVDADNVGGGALMARHLISLGHRRIALVVGPSRYPASVDRASGFTATMEAAGLDPLIISSEFRPDAARGAVQALLTREPRPTALCLAASDLVTAGLVAIGAAGLRVPGDIALVAFDDHPLYVHFAPALTAVDQPVYEMGACAVKMLLTLIEGHVPDPPRPLLPTRLVVRGSCGGALQASRPGSAVAAP
jgi:LacI family transcriptional regulator